jgi:hypothetical protein
LTGETLAMTRPSGLGLLALIALALVGRWMAPSLDSAVRLQLASDDPAGMSDVLIGRTLTSARAASEIDAALAAGDPDLADSFVALADRHGIAVDPERRASVAAAEQGSVLGTAASFARGAVIGDEGGASGLAGAFAGDMVGIGDVRDLGREGWRIAQGEEPDRLVMGLAAAGLGITAATWLTAGEVAPVRGGLTLVKSLRKAGRLGEGLSRSLGRVVRDAVDLDAMSAAWRSAAGFRLSAARDAALAALRPARLAPLAAVGRDTAALFKRTGARGVEDAFALAKSPREIGRVAKLSEGLGRATRATLKILGRSALFLGKAAVLVAGLVMSLLLYLLAIAMFAARFGRWLGGVRLRRRPRIEITDHVPVHLRFERLPSPDGPI